MKHEPLQCPICERVICGKGEKDHFPVPQRHGGKQTWTLCRSCHDRKDREKLSHENPALAFGWMAGLWAKANADERILLLKILDLIGDAVYAKRDDKSTVRVSVGRKRKSGPGAERTKGAGNNRSTDEDGADVERN